MSEPKRVSLIWIILLALVAVLIVLDVSYGDDHDDHRDNGVDSVLNADSNVHVSGDRMLSLSSSLGDVDIEGCVVTIQRNFVIVGWQSFDYDFWCIARDYDLNGQYKVAAAVRCDIKQIRKQFQSLDACRQGSNFKPKKKPTGKSAVFAALEERLNRYERQREEDTLQREEEAEDRVQANQRYARQQQIQQQQYEEIQHIEDARQKRINLIKEEFGTDEEATAASN